jgi:hypothetical protein
MSMHHPRMNSRHTFLERALGSMLLVFILYGTTVEAAHRHGRILNTSEPVTTTSVSTNGTTEQSTTTLLDCSDCLICQLHLNFTSTSILLRLNDSPNALKTSVSNTPRILLLSQSRAPRAGRAPPTAR